jgi:lysophospholipase L1-like esterase
MVGVGPTATADYKTGILADRDHGIGGTTAYGWIHGFNTGGIDYDPPINDAIAADPDVFLVQVGTNDIPGNTAATVSGRVRAVWAALVATGKPVFGCDILQRASAHNTPTWRDTINEVNTILRASWEADSLTNYLQIDDLQTKDGSGYADPMYYPDNSATPFDGIHPGTLLAHAIAKEFLAVLDPSAAATPPTIPASGSADWVTPNSEVSGDVSGLATGWTAQYLGTIGTDTVFTKTDDIDGDWQHVEIVNESVTVGSPSTQGVYSRLTGAGVTALIGTQCIATARIRIPTGQGLAGVGISVQCVGAAEPWSYNSWCSWQHTVVPIDEYEARIVCDPFTVPTGTTQIWLMICPGRGTGEFEFQDAGVYSA